MWYLSKGYQLFICNRLVIFIIFKLNYVNKFENKQTIAVTKSCEGRWWDSKRPSPNHFLHHTRNDEVGASDCYYWQIKPISFSPMSHFMVSQVSSNTFQSAFLLHSFSNEKYFSCPQYQYFLVWKVSVFEMTVYNISIRLKLCNLWFVFQGYSQSCPSEQQWGVGYWDSLKFK